MVMQAKESSQQRFLEFKERMKQQMKKGGIINRKGSKGSISFDDACADSISEDSEDGVNSFEDANRPLYDL